MEPNIIVGYGHAWDLEIPNLNEHTEVDIHLNATCKQYGGNIIAEINDQESMYNSTNALSNITILSGKISISHNTSVFRMKLSGPSNDICLVN